jgi:putative serine protease PepD
LGFEDDDSATKAAALAKKKKSLRHLSRNKPLFSESLFFFSPLALGAPIPAGFPGAAEGAPAPPAGVSIVTTGLGRAPSGDAGAAGAAAAGGLPSAATREFVSRENIRSSLLYALGQGPNPAPFAQQPTTTPARPAGAASTPAAPAAPTRPHQSQRNPPSGAPVPATPLSTGATSGAARPAGAPAQPPSGGPAGGAAARWASQLQVLQSMGFTNIAQW